jgi:hypothetical protein
MRKILLSLKPLAETRWEKHEPTGVEFQIAPLPAALDQEMVSKCSDNYGTLNHVAFCHAVAPHIIKGWRGVSDGEVEAVCNDASLKQFVEMHSNRLMPWILARARSLDHFRSEEIEGAKNV